MYKSLRRLFFLLPPERVHYLAMDVFGFLRLLPGGRTMMRRFFRPAAAEPVSVAGLSFRNPVGLGAGFDKNALFLEALDLMQFGFVEIGTVTPVAQAGNPKPRLFRLPADSALINRMGFNNDGCDAVAERLRQWREKFPRSTLIVGGNIGKNKQTPNEKAAGDYARCFTALFPYVDYFTVNVSSPNTPGLRALQDKESLRGILTALQEINRKQDRPKPVFLKIAPDLEITQVDEVLELAGEIRLDGLVVSNTTISREGLLTRPEEVEKIGAGGLSGIPLRARSTEWVKYISQKTGGSLPVMASGGIFNAADAAEKIRAGACLVQVWTGFIYEGPAIVKKILK